MSGPFCFSQAGTGVVPVDFAQGLLDLFRIRLEPCAGALGYLAVVLMAVGRPVTRPMARPPNAPARMPIKASTRAARLHS